MSMFLIIIAVVPYQTVIPALSQWLKRRKKRPTNTPARPVCQIKDHYNKKTFVSLVNNFQDINLGNTICDNRVFKILYTNYCRKAFMLFKPLTITLL